MIRIQNERTIVVLIFLFCLFCFSQGLFIHGVEYRDDEIFYYKSTQEMLSTGDIFSPKYFGEDRFQKPILFYWLVLLSYKIFGANWFGARFVAALFASLTVCFTWKMTREHFSRRISLLSSVIVMTIPLFLRHAKNVVPDMALTFFIVAAGYYALKLIKNPEQAKYATLFFVSCGLGFMIKGIAALAVPILTVIIFAFATKQRHILKNFKFLKGTLILLAIILPWFLYMIKTHGMSYLEYMVVDETKNRIVGSDHSNLLLVQLKRFFNHSLFYLRNIGSYFAPWSLFGLFAIPTLIFKRIEDKQVRDVINFYLIWFFVVFVIFANMYFVINHYMMVLTTPFAILVAYFILEVVAQSKIPNAIMKYFILFILAVATFAFSFLTVFLAGEHRIFLPLFFVGYVAIIWLVCRKNDPIVAPVILGLFVLMAFSQSSLMVKAGVTSHAMLQTFAQTIKEQNDKEYVIGVGSHDIHEKEFQVYFDRRVIKTGHSHDGRAKMQLQKLFNSKQPVYCLLTQKDYQQYADVIEKRPHRMIREEYMVRKRMNLDGGFFKALVTLDQETARKYLMEKIILIRKDENV